MTAKIILSRMDGNVKNGNDFLMKNNGDIAIEYTDYLRKKAKLIIVIPCYNEEAVLGETSKMFLDKLNRMINDRLITEDSRIMFVNDGSSDSSWDLIKALSRQDNHFIGISQSRNRGHQNAVLAGLMEAKDMCDITISIDCDGQDDVEAMSEMVEHYYEGSEIVYGVRNNRDTDTFFKRNTAQWFYKLLNKMGVEAVYNHADYRLVSSKVLNEFEDFHEVNLFLRGMFPLVGFKSSVVSYKRNERIAGESHYPFKKMIGLAWDGITSLSVKPIQIITVIGLFVSLGGLAAIVWAIISSVIGSTVSGWASLLCIVCFMGGIQLLSLGIIGQYIGKIYLETKGRPRYIISERTYKKDE